MQLFISNFTLCFSRKFRERLSRGLLHWIILFSSKIPKKMSNATALPVTTASRPPISHLTVWCTGFIVANVAVVLSNALALGVFCLDKKLLRKRPNHFLICLAVTDLLVGLVVMPLYNYEFVSFWRAVAHGVQMIEGHDSLHDVFTSMDILAGFASIFTLVAIAGERFCSVKWPLYNRNAPKAFSISLIAAAWMLASLLMVAYFLREAGHISELVFVCLLMFSISLSVLLICVFYAFLWKRVKSFGPGRTRSTLRDRRLAVTLTIITVAFTLTWLPFHVVNFVYYFCARELCLPPPTLVYLSKLLHYGNSILNPVVYSFRNQQFRQTLKKLLTFKMSLSGERRSRNDGNRWMRVVRADKGSLARQPAYRRKREAKIVAQ